MRTAPALVTLLLLFSVACSKTARPPAENAASAMPTGSALELFSKAKPLYDAKRFDECAPLMQAAAEKGSAEAQMHLGKMYFNGWGVKHNHETAVEWHKKAAAQGNAESKDKLAKMHGHSHDDH